MANPRKSWALAGPALFLLVLSVFPEFPASSQEAPGSGSSVIKVHFDPRLELLGVALVVGDPLPRGKRKGPGPRFSRQPNDEYASAAIAWFGPTWPATASEVLRRASWRAHGHDALPAYFLNVGLPPGLAAPASLPKDLHGRVGGREARALLDFLRGWIGISRFEEFLASRRTSLEAAEEQIRSRIAGFDITSRLEEFYGTRVDACHVVPVPLLRGKGGWGVVTASGSEIHAFALVGPSKVTDGGWDFGTPEHLRTLILHEFGHGFLRKSLGPEIDSIAGSTGALFLWIIPAMGRQGIPTWEACLEEHLVRAAGARITLRTFGQASAAAEVALYEQQGYSYVRTIYEQFGRYEEKRGTWPNLGSFAPELRSCLEKKAKEEERFIFWSFWISIGVFVVAGVVIWKCFRWLVRFLTPSAPLTGESPPPVQE